MKKIFSILILAIIVFGANAQAPNWAWAKSAGGTEFDFGFSTTTDAAGNVYVAGLFSSPTITFGSTTLTNPDTTGASNGIFVVKYDTFGNVIWANGSGCTENLDADLAITTDTQGNVYLTGHFVSTSITFGTTTLIKTPSVSYYSDIFIVKYDANGNVIWAKSAGGTGDDMGKSITADANGNIYITGWFNSPSIIFGTDTLNSTFSHNYFLVKFDSLGNVLWTKDDEAPSAWSEGLSVTTDILGNIYLTGFFYPPSISFDSLILNNSTSSGLDAEMYVVKFDANGNVIWAKSSGGTEKDFASGVITDDQGNVYVTGYYSSAFISFGATTLNNSNGFSTYDLFIVKYNASGNILWAKTAGGWGDDIAYGITIDSYGNIYIIGTYALSISFGATTLTSNGAIDIFVVKLDTLGNGLWLKGIGSAYNEFCGNISISASDNLYVTGAIGPYVAFGMDTLNSSSTSEMFIAKLDATIVSIDNKSLPDELSTYPNPSTGIFKIKYSNNIKSIEVFNTMGDLVLRQGNDNEVNLQEFPIGLYLARINGVHVCKLLKE
jgi:hypothetical protein